MGFHEQTRKPPKRLSENFLSPYLPSYLPLLLPPLGVSCRIFLLLIKWFSSEDFKYPFFPQDRVYSVFYKFICDVHADRVYRAKVSFVYAFLWHAWTTLLGFYLSTCLLPPEDRDQPEGRNWLRLILDL